MMTNLKATKRALGASVLSIVLCISMLVGTTFAWFTDTASNTGNRIVAGNLEVDLLMWNGTGYGSIKDGQGDIFAEADVAQDSNKTLWEPGKTQIVYLAVENLGTLDLKYQFHLNVTGDGLQNALQYQIFTGEADTDSAYGGKVAAADLDWTNAKTLANDIVPGTLIVSDSTKVNKIDYIALAVHMREDAGNEYRDTEAIIDVTVLATQMDSEDDYFDNTYDVDAPYTTPWDGTADTAWYDDAATGATTYTLTTAADMAGLAELVNAGNSFAGKTVELAADVNLAGLEWTPIGACDSQAYFQGTFDGKGHTISNLYVDKSADTYQYTTAGLFGWVDAAGATIKNVNIDGAVVMGSHWVGAVAGYMTGEISKVTVTNSTVMGFNVNNDANGDKVGGLVGYMNSGAGKLDGNTVSNTAVIGYRDVAGLAGAVATTNTVTNNKVEKVTVTHSADYVGQIVSPKTAVVVDATNVATDVTIKNATLTLDAASGLYNCDKTYYVIDAEDLVKAAEFFNGQANSNESRQVVVELMADMDLTGVEWPAWDVMYMTLNGNGHTISNVTTTQTGYAGLFGYAGAVTVNDLTLENVNATGAEVGTFAGRTEGAKFNNCYLTGNNSVTFVATTSEEMGIGAISGVTIESALNVTIEENTTVTVSKNDIKSEYTKTKFEDNLIGYSFTTYAINSGTITNNGKINVKQTAATDAALDAAIKDGASTVTLSAGTYIIPDSAKGKTLTIIGTGDTKIATQDDGSYEGCDYSLDGATVTFENITINTDSSTYTGYARLNATYNNCTINGTYTLYGDSVFNDCTFNVTGDVYNIWTWGAPNATFNDCTFTSDGKAILLYGTVDTKLTLNDCEFNDNGGLTDKKAAVEIGDDYGKSYELIVNNATVNGYEINDKGINTGSTLWANKNSMGSDKLNVVVDGVDIY